MPEKKKPYLALDKALFFVNDPIVHKNSGYTAVIKKILARGNAVIEIPNTAQNKAIWDGCKLPMTIKAQQVIKHFKHEILILNL